MNYEDFFTKRSTSEISKDLLGRTLSFNNGNEILSGTIVEAEAYVGVKDRAAHSYGGRRSQANEGLYRRGGSLYIYSQRQYFFLMSLVKKLENHKEFLFGRLSPLPALIQ